MWSISQRFKKTLREEHQFATKVELLDTNFRPVEDDTIFSAEQTNEIQNFISDGSIDVDYSRGTRRTAELTLLNPTAVWTPQIPPVGGDFAGKIYLNRVIRIFRGVYIEGTPEYAPVGTFMIDNAEIIVERNMSLVVLTLSDLWKKLQKSVASVDGPIGVVGETYGAVVRRLIEDTGATFPYYPIIDNLDDRDNDDKKLSKKLQITAGESRGDFLKARAKEWDLDVYFDPMGQFRMEDRRRASDKAVIWDFYSSSDRTGMMANIRRSISDDNLYNHVIVIGGEKGGIRREKKDEDPNSYMNIQRLGDRCYFVKDDKLKNATQVERALNHLWEVRFRIIETVQADVICNPALEADDVVRIKDNELALVDKKFRLKRFTVPLISSRQTIQATNVVNYDGENLPDDPEYT